MNVSESVITNQFAISTFGEYFLPSVNRNTFEKIDSKTAFKKRFKETIFQEDSLHIIVGLDSGLLANYVLESPVPMGSKYIFVELDPVLALLNVEIDAEKQKQIQILTFDQFQSEMESGDNDLYLIKEQYVIHHSFASTMGIIEEYSSLINLVDKQLSFRAVERKSHFEQKIFLIQQLKNLAENQYPAALLNGKFTGKTCIIIGGGPSLDEHFDWIVDNYHQLFVITVSRMASRLSNAGIPAHIIVSVDPQDFSFEVNRDMMALTHESLFINSHHVNHRLISQWLGKSLYLGSKLPWADEDTNNIPTVGPTVTNSAVRVAIELGFKDILLTGADFCYSSDGVSHANGAVEANAGSNNSRIGEWVETYAGNIAETIVQLIYAGQALTEDALNYPHANIINLSENAAKLDGVHHQKVESIKLQSAGISPKQLLELVPDGATEKSVHLNKMMTEVNQAIQDLEQIKALANKAIELNEQARGLEIQSKKSQLVVSKIDKIESQLKDKYSALSQVIKFYGYYEFSKFLTTQESETWSVEHMQNMTHRYYEAFHTLAIELLGYLNQAANNLTMRQWELAETAPITQLVDHWRASDQPGRVHNVSQLRSQLNLAFNTDDACLQQIANEYQVQLTSMEHPYFSLKKTNMSLHNTFAKIIDLYKSKNHTGLSQLINSVEPMVDGDGLAQRLYYLAQSYLAILSDDNHAALSHLQQIAPENRTEVELKQILILALKVHNIELAESTLEAIIHYSDEYLPQYAHVLTLQGKNQQALNTYLDYLDKYPTDISVLLKMGVFLAEMGQIEGARSSFNQVLTIDPENLTAANYLLQLQA
ncbi:6-hydroxymethylpterin diphosphokinase MptE-like protein [Shewanella pneumatophori]|uniref:DUF115 domain-containing protein n=1 Tax=Shewanella pneumatophori TaxID=314092 RepID=A0A9X1ZDI3_9GAMM|nr:6-hydroxymethylpterin diphosphokinase MptE-like protein [Shewanella pneumatophori]MCL1139673.1 DUF115 domain-containing protein [Shewanella pneumatophori]